MISLSEALKESFTRTFELRQHSPFICDQQVKSRNISLNPNEIISKLNRFIHFFPQTFFIDIGLKNKIAKKICSFPIDSELQKNDVNTKNGYAVKTYGSVKARHKKMPNYFGKGQILTLQDIKIVVHSYDMDVMGIVTTVLPYLLVIHNFGQRQSKGFGSFTISDQKDLETTLTTLVGYQRKMGFLFKKELEGSEHKLLQEIAKDYSVLKSKNLDHSQNNIITHKDYPQGPVRRPLIWHYINSQMPGVSWEKAKFKRDYFKRFKFERDDKRSYVLRSQKNRDGRWNSDFDEEVIRKNRTQEFQYYRVFLGFSSTYSFMTNGGPKFIVKLSNKTIDRVNAPIHFKILDQSVFMMPYFEFGSEFTAMDIKGEVFDLTYFKDAERLDGDGTITVPDIDFSPRDFLLHRFGDTPVHSLIGYSHVC